MRLYTTLTVDSQVSAALKPIMSQNVDIERPFPFPNMTDLSISVRRLLDETMSRMNARCMAGMVPELMVLWSALQKPQKIAIDASKKSAIDEESALLGDETVEGETLA